MTDIAHLRATIAQHLGQPLTPEVAAAIECAAVLGPQAGHEPAKFGEQTYRGYVFKVERLADILPEMHRLHEQHWAETEGFRHGLTMDPDYQAMLADERAGRMLQFTVRLDGELVGNLRLYLSVSRHTQTKVAREDTLFLTAAHRGGLMAVRFLEFAEDSLRLIGVTEMRADSKVVRTPDGRVKRAGVLLERMGYQPVATQYVKMLKP